MTNDEFEILSFRMEKIQRRLEILEAKLCKQESKIPESKSTSLRSEIISHIERIWEHQRMPVEASVLGQQFGKKVNSAGEQLRELLDQLVSEPESRIAEIIKYTKGRLYLPRSAFRDLSEIQLDFFQGMGMTEKQIKKHRDLKDLQVRANELSSDGDDSALIAQLKAMGAKLDEEGDRS